MTKGADKKLSAKEQAKAAQEESRVNAAMDEQGTPIFGVFLQTYDTSRRAWVSYKELALGTAENLLEYYQSRSWELENLPAGLPAGTYRLKYKPNPEGKKWLVLGREFNVVPSAPSAAPGSPTPAPGVPSGLTFQEYLAFSAMQSARQADLLNSKLIERILTPPAAPAGDSPMQIFMAGLQFAERTLLRNNPPAITEPEAGVDGITLADLASGQIDQSEIPAILGYLMNSPAAGMLIGAAKSWLGGKSAEPVIVNPSPPIRGSEDQPRPERPPRPAAPVEPELEEPVEPDELEGEPSSDD